MEPSGHELFGSSQATDTSYQNFMETQVQLITSSNVLDGRRGRPWAAARMPEMRAAAADPEAGLRRNAPGEDTPQDLT